MSREIVHRVTVDVDRDAEGLEAELVAHLEKRPSGYGARLLPFGFTFRREPAVFHFVATGTSLGTAIMLAEFSTRIRALAPFAVGFSAAFFCLALYTLSVFFRNLAARLEISADGEAVTIRQHGLLRTEVHRLPAGQIVGVIVAVDEDGTRSVVIAGPRHSSLLDVHRAKLLDPDTLPVWLADGVGIVARRATIRDAGAAVSG
jgi:hypothetical protein